MYRHLMVPLDGSELSVGTIDRAVSLARALGAKITFLHASAGEGPVDSSEGQRSAEPTPSDVGIPEEARVLFAKAEAAAREADVPCTTLAVTSDRPYEAILDGAETQGCDLVFMASHGRRGTESLVLGSQTHKVLQHATIPVLVSAVERSLQDPRHIAPWTMIRGEHRSLALVLHGLEYLVRQSRKPHAPPEFSLLHAMLHYISAFPEKLHHPKEDRYLFRKLRERTPEFNETLDELERQHVAGRALVTDLEQTLARYEAHPSSGLAAFATAVQRFAAMQWEHMKLEEKVIIPAAQKYLTHDDLTEIASAFAENGDPHFSRDADDEFRQLFTDILDLVPKRIFDGPTHDNR
jgi:nucleotide-binding universal stress UspA family protein/hemerythrin-like domain-containing protein